MSSRRVALVLGDPLGQRLLSGVLESLRMRAPDPAWVDSLHGELLARANVAVDDARPSAWFETGKWAANGVPRTRATEWLGQQFAPEPDDEVEPELVVKDPRLTWFLGLWKAAAMRCDAEPVFLTALRAPADVVSGADNPTGALAGWLNLALHTEKATRGVQRAFVRYDDLLADWTVPIFRAGQVLGLRSVAEASANDMRKVHQFLDRDLASGGASWSELGVPAGVADLAERSWAELSPLGDEGGDTPDRHAALDALREEYVATYEQAERLTASSALAASRVVPAESAQSTDDRSRKRLFGR